MADLPLKSGKLAVLIAWLFLCCYRNFYALAVMFKPPNGKPFGYQNLRQHKAFVGVAHTHNL
ncbi:hypothetical protein [Ruminococcus sp.]|uniref:hypothetical protein n=1 Tax=Ruminococcus sp. TaxID=41978 RepID=UPI003FD890CD